MVVHHDQLKHSHIPFQVGEPVCPSREVGEFQVVDVTPPQLGIDSFPRAGPARLRQRINPPNRYGYGRHMFSGREHIGGGQCNGYLIMDKTKVQMCK